MEEKTSKKEFVAAKRITEQQIIHRGSVKTVSSRRLEKIRAENKKKINSVVYKNTIAKKTEILGKNKGTSILGSQSIGPKEDEKTNHGINNDSSIKKIKRNKDGKTSKKRKSLAKARMINVIRNKWMERLMKSDNPTETVEIMTKKGIEKIIAIIMLIVRKILLAAAKLALNLFIMLSPILLFLSPIIIILMCVAGLAGNASAKDKHLVFGITGDLNYVSYLQGNYQGQYGETGWCGITSFADVLASYGCTSPYDATKLINPCDTVRYADENGLAIIGERDRVHYLNEAWYESLCSEYGLEFSSVRNDGGYKGETLLSWVNEKLDDGWQVVVCFDAYSKYENGAYITRDRHYIWLTCYADSNHDTYAAIDPGNGCADQTFLSEATTEGGYRDLIVNKSQIINYTGGTNYITGFAIKLPDLTDQH